MKNYQLSLSNACVVTLICAPLLGCPTKPSAGPSSDDEPSLVLSSASQCTQQILPETDLSAESVEPVFLPLEIRMTGIPGSEASQLTTKISFLPGQPKACFLSSVTDDNGEVASLRCPSATSKELSFSGSRAYDAFYCTGTGRFLVKAKTTLNDEAGTVVESNEIEVSCLPQQVFEENCERVGEEEPTDMELDMELDMEMLDMGEERPLPASWSVVYSSTDEATTNLSVQGSTSPYPKNETFTFEVIDQEGSPIENVSVKFFLDWSALDGYQTCEQTCEIESEQTSCEDRPNCLWTETSVDGEGSAGEEAGDEAGQAGLDDPISPSGFCGPNPMSAGVDERCSGRTERCEANLCLPPSIAALPLVMEPYEAITDINGIARVSVVTTNNPGVYSVKAVASYNGNEQEARTPSLTIWHQIPSQRHVSLSCQAPVTATFARRTTPVPGSPNDSLGYNNYQKLAAECRFQSADRFSGRVSNVPVFFMSESGNMAQSTVSDETGIAKAEWYAGGSSPIDLDPKSWSMPYIDVDHDRRCTDGVDIPAISAMLNGGGCNGRIFEGQRVLLNSEQQGTLPLIANSRDGLIRVIAFTQGEARFIDLGDSPEEDGDGFYQSDRDLVPPQPEPFIDANDNGEFDQGEEDYQDSNRNGVWDADVFGRDQEEINSLKCIDTLLPFIAQGGQLEGLQPGDALYLVKEDCDLGDIDDVEDLINDLRDVNPASLQASIWTSVNLLGVGLPNLTEAVDLNCGPSPACYDKALRPGPAFPCSNEGNFNPNLDYYLDLSVGSPGGFFNGSFYPRDDNMNCVGIEGVSIQVALDGLSANGQVPPGLLNAKPVAVFGQGFSPSLEDCFDDYRSEIPAPSSYHFALSGEVTPGEPPAVITPETYTFEVVNLRFEIDTPDHSVRNGGTLKSSVNIPIGVCR